MFGMEKKGKKKVGGTEDWEFDLEKQLKNTSEMRTVKTQTEERITRLKNLLRQGEDKQMFDNCQTLLHGYLALQKVLGRVTGK